MGAISYDPNKFPTDGLRETLKVAVELNNAHFFIDCASGDPDEGGVKLSAIGPAVPRVGDDLLLQDGKLCRVTQVVHAPFTVKGLIEDSAAIVLVPIVYAMEDEKPASTEWEGGQ